MNKEHLKRFVKKMKNEERGWEKGKKTTEKSPQANMEELQDTQLHRFKRSENNTEKE